MKNYFNSDDNNLKWEQKQKEILLKTCVFDVTSCHNCSVNGAAEGDYIILDARDWVIVIPEHNDNFLMVKQWRHGINKLSIEFPGGVIDKGEDPKTAALRELQEETGYTAKKIVKLAEVNPNPALFSNKCHIFLAENLEKVGNQNLDSDEFINYMELSKNEVLEGMGTEQFPHALMGTALLRYISYRRPRILS